MYPEKENLSFSGYLSSFTRHRLRVAINEIVNVFPHFDSPLDIEFAYSIYICGSREVMTLLSNIFKFFQHNRNYLGIIQKSRDLSA